MAEATDRYMVTRLAAELGRDNRKMRDILTRVNPVQVKGRSKLYLLRDVIPHAAKYLGAPDVIDLIFTKVAGKIVGKRVDSVQCGCWQELTP